MYIPSHFQQTNLSEALKFIETHPMGMVLSSKENQLVGNHLPFMQANTATNANEIILAAHFARANPQWQSLSDQQALVVFAGPNAYIPASIYDDVVSVPTWNYIAVHVYGRCELVADHEYETMMQAFIAQFDAPYLAVWSTLPPEYKSKMLSNIVWFRLHVSEIQAKEKLSQNKSVVERQRVADHLLAGSDLSARELGCIMKSRA